MGAPRGFLKNPARLYLRALRRAGWTQSIRPGIWLQALSLAARTADLFFAWLCSASAKLEEDAAGSGKDVGAGGDTSDREAAKPAIAELRPHAPALAQVDAHTAAASEVIPVHAFANAALARGESRTADAKDAVRNEPARGKQIKTNRAAVIRHIFVDAVDLGEGKEVDLTEDRDVLRQVVPAGAAHGKSVHVAGGKVSAFADAGISGAERHIAGVRSDLTPR